MNLFLTVVWKFSPTLVHLGSFELRYYGLMWALGFAVSMLLFVRFIRREGYPEKMFDSIFWYAVLSCIIGSRLGHCLFYEPETYLKHPLEILKIWEGGLASHGAAIGLLVGLWLFSRKNRMPYLWSLDRIMIAVTISGALVRLGNLFNSEIYGVQTDLPWGFIFVRTGETVPKHPTQIYEALCYIVGFAILLWFYYKRDMARRRPGFMFGLGLVIVFLSRFLIEFIKMPQESFEQGMFLDMGQLLSLPFIIAGIAFMALAFRKPALQPEPIALILERREAEMRRERKVHEKREKKASGKR